MNVQNNDVEVTFTVMVPAGVDFVGRTVSGNLEASNLGSNAFWTTVSGNATVSTSPRRGIFGKWDDF